MENNPNARGRVSEAQFNILLDFLERHPVMVQGCNNTRVKRDQNNRLWQMLASLLNTNRHKFRKGMVRSAKRWAIYVSNYKCKLKKTIAAMEKSDKAVLLEFSDKEVRFMVATGLVSPSDVKNINWDPMEEPSTSTEPEFLNVDEKSNENMNMENERNDFVSSKDHGPDDDDSENDFFDKTKVKITQAKVHSPVGKTTSLPRKPPFRRRPQHYKSPQTSLNTVLNLLKKQQASIDAQGRLLKRIAHASSQNSNSTNNIGSLNLIAYNLGRLADAADRYVTNHVRRNRTSAYVN